MAAACPAGAGSGKVLVSMARVSAPEGVQHLVCTAPFENDRAPSAPFSHVFWCLCVQVPAFIPRQYQRLAVLGDTAVPPPCSAPLAMPPPCSAMNAVQYSAVVAQCSCSAVQCSASDFCSFQRHAKQPETPKEHVPAVKTTPEPRE
eukprot:gene16771-biopygen17282